jgi:hypothetical protein
MDTIALLVTAAGLVLAGWVIWYFFFSGQSDEPR